MEIKEEMYNPFLTNGLNIEEVKKDIKTEPKYEVGEIVDLETWGGSKKNFKIEDIKITYHPRMYRYCWGYMLSGKESTGLNFTYIPEGYLRKQVKKEKDMEKSKCCEKCKETNCSKVDEVANAEGVKPSSHKNTARPSKDEYYIGIAEAVLARSTCLRRKYGSVLVKNDEIVSTGYNGSPRKEVNCIDTGHCEREDQGVPKGERYELCVAIHSEDNAITSAGREKALDATLYIVGKNTADGSYANPCPCMMCRRKIVNAGIKRVVGLFVDNETGNKEIRDIDFK